METYQVYYHYGEHHILIETNKKSFFKIIDDMSEEFTIYRLDIDNIKYYNVINYYGDLDTIGKIEIVDPEEKK